MSPSSRIWLTSGTIIKWVELVIYINMYLYVYLQLTIYKKLYWVSEKFKVLTTCSLFCVCRAIWLGKALTHSVLTIIIMTSWYSWIQLTVIGCLIEETECHTSESHELLNTADIHNTNFLQLNCGNIENFLLLQSCKMITFYSELLTRSCRSFKWHLMERFAGSI